MKYYRIFGKNRYIPVCVCVKCESQADAKILFYLDYGTDISGIYKISKKEYKSAMK
jgi:hypothetical protein